MAGYRILSKPGAAKELEAVGQRRDRERLVERIRSLGRDPRPPGCEKLSTQSGLFRVRVATYRVVYSVDDGAAEVHIIRVGYRKDGHR